MTREIATSSRSRNDKIHYEQSGLTAGNAGIIKTSIIPASPLQFIRFYSFN
jgi:hypothetical protein